MTKTRIWLFLQDYGEVLALLVAITATLGSLYYSEVAKFVPCTLCWYQRILMYPLTLILLVGIIKQDEHLPFYVLPFSLLGMGVSTYHVLIENGVISHPTTCTTGVPCSLRYVNYLGFITIPLMALTAFTLITVIMIATHRAFSHELGGDAGQTAVSTIPESRSAPYAWALLLATVLVLIALWALAAFRSWESNKALTTTAALGPASGQALFQQPTLGTAPGCIACHSLDPGVAGIGPSLAGIAGQAGQRVPGQSGGNYLRQSIIAPDSQVVDGFAAGVMYQGYEEALTESQVDGLVTFLLTLE